MTQLNQSPATQSPEAMSLELASPADVSHHMKDVENAVMLEEARLQKDPYGLGQALEM